MILGLLLVISPFAVYPIVHNTCPRNANARKGIEKGRDVEGELKGKSWGKSVMDRRILRFTLFLGNSENIHKNK